MSEAVNPLSLREALEKADALMERASPKDAWDVLCKVGDVVGDALASTGGERAPAMRLSDISEYWRQDSLRWRGAVLTGLCAHWCWDWDGLPIDETSYEWPCACAV